MELPPAGPGLKTVMLATPLVARSLAGIWAVTNVLLTNSVGRSLPFQRTTDPDTKFEPPTAKVKAAPPSAAAWGDREPTVGMGLFVVLMIPTSAIAVLVESATEVAKALTVDGLGTLAGALYFPVSSIIPQLAPEQPVPERLQVTAWFALWGLTLAVNCCTPPVSTVAFAGVTVTVKASDDGGGWLVPPAHPTKNIRGALARTAINFIFIACVLLVISSSGHHGLADRDGLWTPTLGRSAPEHNRVRVVCGCFSSARPAL